MIQSDDSGVSFNRPWLTVNSRACVPTQMVSCRQFSVALFVAFVGFVLKTVYDTGAFKTLIAHGEDTCRRIAGPPGMEDLALYNTSDGHVLAFSGSDSREKWFGIGYFHSTTQSQRIAAIPATEQGGIYAID